MVNDDKINSLIEFETARSELFIFHPQLLVAGLQGLIKSHRHHARNQFH